MARLSSHDLTRLRGVPAVTVLIALAVHAKRDVSFVPTKSLGTERWHATVGAAQFELLLTGPKFFDTRAKIGGGGAIDLAMHLHCIGFADAVDLLKLRGI